MANINVYKVPCVICGHIKHNGEYNKYRICESTRAEKFLEAAMFLKDDTYTRTCDLNSTSSIFGADIYYHKNCFKKYLKNYANQTKGKVLEKSKLSLFTEFIQSIDSKLQARRWF